jgi:hypothetical protein
MAAVKSYASLSLSLQLKPLYYFNSPKAESTPVYFNFLFEINKASVTQN